VDPQHREPGKTKEDPHTPSHVLAGALDVKVRIDSFLLNASRNVSHGA
jgi:hypothetical protein